MNYEQIVSNFMAQQYTTERLVQLLAWTQDGGLSFGTCCCFIGLVTSDHSFKRAGEVTGWVDDVPHYRRALELPGAELAEVAFGELGKTDEEAREKLIPLIHAELSSREQLHVEQPVLETVGV